MSISVSVHSKAIVTETYSSYVDPSDATVTFTGPDTEESLTASTTPPVTKHAEYSKGTGTIDLLLVPVNGQSGVTQTFTGLKVQVAKFSNPSTNANAITITFGASNGYLLGGTGWKLILQPGEEWLYKGLDTSPDVDGTHKEIDITATSSQTLDIQLVAG